MAATARYIEIVNWRRAQPTMTGSGNQWLKLYTSLLDNDTFLGLCNEHRMTVIALWLYAARSGHYIFPADSAWLRRRIPLLSEKLDLDALADARDSMGHPTPFIRYVNGCALAADQGGAESAETGRRQGAGAGGAESRLCECGAILPTGRLKCDGCKRLRHRQRAAKSYRNRSAPSTGRRKREKKRRPKKPQGPKTGAGKTDLRRPPGFVRLGDVATLTTVDFEAERFGLEVFEALGLNQYLDPASKEGRREWKSFAAWLVKAKSRTPATQWPGLWAKGVSRAQHIARHGKSSQKPGAVWHSLMSGHVGHRKEKAS